MGFTVSFYDTEDKHLEDEDDGGESMYWAAEQSVKRVGKIPDAIFNLSERGDDGMLIVLGESAEKVAGVALKIATRISK